MKPVTQEKLSKTEAARRLSFTATPRGAWVRNLATGVEPMGYQMREELRPLKEENRQLKMKRSLLKKPPSSSRSKNDAGQLYPRTA